MAETRKRMWNKEERRVLINAPHEARDGSDGGLICSVIKRHTAYEVVERYPYLPGEPCRDASYMVFPLGQNCTCQQPYPCLHAKAARRADPEGNARL